MDFEKVWPPVPLLEYDDERKDDGVEFTSEPAGRQVPDTVRKN